MSTTQVEACPLCRGQSGRVVLRTERFRLVQAAEPGYPAFYRILWNDHVREFSDLPEADRRLCMDAVVLVEQALRRHVRPDKVNVATLGNQVPHLHWHVVARFSWDPHFPGSVWSAALREPPPASLREVEAALPDLERELAEALLALAA